MKPLLNVEIISLWVIELCVKGKSGVAPLEPIGTGPIEIGFWKDLVLFCKKPPHPATAGRWISVIDISCFFSIYTSKARKRKARKATNSNCGFSLVMNTNSCVAQACNARYCAPSHLALDVHCSPKKTQFATFRGIYYKVAININLCG